MPKLARLAFAVGTLVITGAGCRRPQANILGKPAAAHSTTEVRALAGKRGRTVAVRGEMIQMCPVAGCWFMLRDKTGVVRVDTKQAGFVVSDIPLHTRMLVTGTVNGDDGAGIDARGIRY